MLSPSCFFMAFGPIFWLRLRVFKLFTRDSAMSLVSNDEQGLRAEIYQKMGGD
jgi:hypothetical protein